MIPTVTETSFTPPQLDIIPKAGLSKFEHLKKIINMIALIIFNSFVFYNGGANFWTVSIFIGAIASDFVQERITNLFNEMSWKWLVGTTAILYAYAWPATIPMQAILAGLDMGCRCSQAARGTLKAAEGEKIFLCFRI
jgi:hypothetical protein